MTWDYPLEGEYDEPNIESITKEVSGYNVADGSPVLIHSVADRPTAVREALAASPDLVAAATPDEPLEDVSFCALDDPTCEACQ